MQWPQKVVNKLKPHLQIHEWLIKQNTTKASAIYFNQAQHTK